MSRLADHHIEELQQASRNEYVTHNETPSLSGKTVGSYRVGFITASFEDLVLAFGMPRRLDNTYDGTFYQWDIEFGDGTIATIYDYNMKQPGYDVMDWHVGGKSFDAATLVATAVLRAV